MGKSSNQGYEEEMFNSLMDAINNAIAQCNNETCVGKEYSGTSEEYDVFHYQLLNGLHVYQVSMSPNKESSSTVLSSCEIEKRPYIEKTMLHNDVNFMIPAEKEQKVVLIFTKTSNKTTIRYALGGKYTRYTYTDHWDINHYRAMPLKEVILTKNAKDGNVKIDGRYANPEFDDDISAHVEDAKDIIEVIDRTLEAAKSEKKFNFKKYIIMNAVEKLNKMLGIRGQSQRETIDIDEFVKTLDELRKAIKSGIEDIKGYENQIAETEGELEKITSELKSARSGLKRKKLELQEVLGKIDVMDPRIT